MPFALDPYARPVFGGEVPAVATNATPGQVLAALLATGISQQAAAILLAQSALECANWKGGLWNWNLGNITSTGQGDYQVLPGLPAMKFLTYATLADGAQGFVNYLRAKGALAVADTGDVDAYVDKLKAINYAGTDTTGTLYANYAAGMKAKMAAFASVVPSAAAPVLSPLSAAKLDAWASLFTIAAGAATLYTVFRLERPSPSRSGKRAPA